MQIKIRQKIISKKINKPKNFESTKKIEQSKRLATKRTHLTVLKKRPKINLETINPTVPELSKLASQMSEFLIGVNPNHIKSNTVRKIAERNRDRETGKDILRKKRIYSMGEVFEKTVNGEQKKIILPSNGCHQLSLAFYEALKQIEKNKKIKLNPKISRSGYPQTEHSTVIFQLNNKFYEADLFKMKGIPKVIWISNETALKKIYIKPRIITTQEFNKEIKRGAKKYLKETRSQL